MAKTFSIADYCLFGLTLLLSAGIGLFFSLRRRKNAEEVFTGGQHMPLLPTALSLTTSFLSGVTLLGLPVEVYKRGIFMWLSRFVGTAVACLFAMVVVMPILFEFRPVSVYEYFEARFHSKFLRKCGAVLYLLFMLSYMGVVLYAPSVALSGVTGVQPWVFYLVVGFVCNIYTSFGGLKAVVWTDTFQAVCMYGGLITLIAKGLIDNGGIYRTYNISKEYGRLDMSNIDVNPFQYMTLWTSVFGGIGFWFMLLTFNQISVQRYFSVATLGKAQKVLGMTIPGYATLTLLADSVGLLMFVYYLGCDPITSKQIAKADQLVIHYALDTIGEYPGLPGVFLACLFSGTLSTISSGINSMAAVFWEDILMDYLPNVYEKTRLIIVTVVALCFGFLAMGMAGMAGPMGGILQTALTVMGAIGGPICGLFMLGMLFPQANRYGAIIGLFFSLFITGLIAIGNVVWKPYAKYAMELPVGQCHALNLSTPASEFLHLNGSSQPNWSGISYLYTLCELFYPTLSIVVVIVIGWPISLVWKDHTPPTREIGLKGVPRRYKPRLCITEFFRERKPNVSQPMEEKPSTTPKSTGWRKRLGLRSPKIQESSL